MRMRGHEKSGNQVVFQYLIQHSLLIRIQTSEGTAVQAHINAHVPFQHIFDGGDQPCFAGGRRRGSGLSFPAVDFPLVDEGEHNGSD